MLDRIYNLSRRWGDIKPFKQVSPAIHSSLLYSIEY
jgi:hypothetical protein